MIRRYLVTGATGFLGRAVVRELEWKAAEVTALVMKGDPYASELPENVRKVTGDVLDAGSLDRFFSHADRDTCVIHCAGIVSVASDPGGELYRVNVGGTDNILRCCRMKRVAKLVYVSSVHAIPEKRKGEIITEDAVFSPDLVRGAYAKSKAEATELVLEAAARGLDASVVFPSGIIGPGDPAGGSFTSMLRKYTEGRLRAAVRGGYDFVDVRDAARSIVACSAKGGPGKGYILSGHYASVEDILRFAGKALGCGHRVLYLPLTAAKLAAPFYERRSLRKGEPLFFTPCSVSLLDANCSFSNESAARDLGHAARSVEESVRDTVYWIHTRDRLASG